MAIALKIVTGQVRQFAAADDIDVDAVSLRQTGAGNNLTIGANMGGTDGEVQLGTVNNDTRVLGDLIVDGAATVTSTSNLDGDVNLGDGTGDTINVGGGGTDTVNLGGGASDVVNLNNDLVVGAGVVTIGSAVTDYLGDIWLDIVTGSPADGTNAAVSLNAGSAEAGTRLTAGANAIGVGTGNFSTIAPNGDLQSTLEALDAAITGGGAASLQTAYDNGRTITIGSVTETDNVLISNPNNANGGLEISQTFAGGGVALQVTSGASATGVPVNILHQGTNVSALQINDGATNSLSLNTGQPGGTNAIVSQSAGVELDIVVVDSTTIGENGGGLDFDAGGGGGATGGTPAGNGGAVTVNAGAGGAGDTGVGDVAGAGGAITLTSGAGGASGGTEAAGAGGNVTVNAGAGGAGNASGGVAQPGGQITVTAGAGGADGGSGVPAAGGQVQVTAGSAGTGGNAAGGGVTITAGNSEGTTAGGDVTVNAGAGNGTGADGQILIGQSNTSAITVGVAGSPGSPATVNHAQVTGSGGNPSVGLNATGDPTAGSYAIGIFDDPTWTAISPANPDLQSALDAIDAAIGAGGAIPSLEDVITNAGTPDNNVDLSGTIAANPVILNDGGAASTNAALAITRSTTGAGNGLEVTLSGNGGGSAVDLTIGSVDSAVTVSDGTNSIDMDAATFTIDGGNFAFDAVTAPVTVAGRAYSMTGGTGGAASGAAGGAGGAASLVSGVGGASDGTDIGGDGGVASLTGGNGGAGSGTVSGGDGGAIAVDGGNGGELANGGAITIASGDGGGTLAGAGAQAGNAGIVFIHGGVPGAAGAAADGPAGAAGNVTVRGGIGGAGSADFAASNGGLLSLQGGDAGTDGGGGGANGGNVEIDAGAATGAGTDGVINIGITTASAITIGTAGAAGNPTTVNHAKVSDGSSGNAVVALNAGRAQDTTGAGAAQVGAYAIGVDAEALTNITVTSPLRNLQDVLVGINTALSGVLNESLQTAYDTGSAIVEDDTEQAVNITRGTNTGTELLSLSDTGTAVVQPVLTVTKSATAGVNADVIQVTKTDSDVAGAAIYIDTGSSLGTLSNSSGASRAGVFLDTTSGQFALRGDEIVGFDNVGTKTIRILSSPTTSTGQITSWDDPATAGAAPSDLLVDTGDGGPADAGNNAAVGGDLTISTGVGGQGFADTTPKTGATGGPMIIIAGDGGDGNSDDTLGNEADAGAGGTISVTGGTGGDSSSGLNNYYGNAGAGGAVTVSGGTGGPGNGVGFQAGVAGDGGTLSLVGGTGGAGGTGSNPNGSGGDVTINAGPAGAGGDGSGTDGQVNIGSADTSAIVVGETTYSAPATPTLQLNSPLVNIAGLGAFAELAQSSILFSRSSTNHRVTQEQAASATGGGVIQILGQQAGDTGNNTGGTVELKGGTGGTTDGNGGNVTLDGGTPTGTGTGGEVQVGTGGDTSRVIVGSTGAVGDLYGRDVNVTTASRLLYDTGSGTSGSEAIGVYTTPLTNIGVIASDALQDVLEAIDTTIGSGGGTTLQSAYDAGQTIDIDSQDTTVTIQAQDTDHTAALLTLNRAPASNQLGDGLVVTMQGNTQGNGIDLTNSGTGNGVDVDNTSTGNAMVVREGGTAVMVIGNGGFDWTGANFDVITQAGSGVTLTGDTGGTVSCNSGALSLTSGGTLSMTTTGGGMSIDSSSTLTMFSDDATQLQMDANDAAIKAITILANNAGAGQGNIVLDADDVIDLDSASFNADTTGAISLDAGAASNFSTSAGNITIDAAAAELVLDDVGNSSITLSETGDRTLDTSFTATSIIGALNELKTGTTRANVTFAATVNSTTAASAGQLLAIDDQSGSSRAFQADANGSGEVVNAVGFAATAAAIDTEVEIIVSGELTVPDALWDSAPGAADAGKRVYMSTTAGNVTLTAPSGSGETVLRVGIVSFADASADTTRVAVQIGEGTVLA